MCVSLFCSASVKRRLIFLCALVHMHVGGERTAKFVEFCEIEKRGDSDMADKRLVCLLVEEQIDLETRHRLSLSLTHSLTQVD